MTFFDKICPLKIDVVSPAETTADSVCPAEDDDNPHVVVIGKSAETFQQRQSPAQHWKVNSFISQGKGLRGTGNAPLLAIDSRKLDELRESEYPSY